MSRLQLLLRAEHAALFVAGIVAYLALGGNWLLAIPLLLSIDLSMVGYLAGSRVGAITYNLGHNLVAVAVVAGIGWWTGLGWVQLLGAVWLAHVGMDRALGYGLKLPTDFRDTHLGRIGH
ncbi:MAG TPA: DUF4260 domain-containing protein [Candidatus Limnocylindria bacterium]|nr:DUF4260 domain-containing protein [Candidatus Limnocylindria bacterium]